MSHNNYQIEHLKQQIEKLKKENKKLKTEIAILRSGRDPGPFGDGDISYEAMTTPGAWDFEND